MKNSAKDNEYEEIAPRTNTADSRKFQNDRIGISTTTKTTMTTTNKKLQLSQRLQQNKGPSDSLYRVALFEFHIMP